MSVPAAGSKATKEQPILVRAGGEISKLNHEYQVIGTFTMPGDVDPRTTVTWYETESGRSVVDCMRTRVGENYGAEVTTPTVYLLAADGAIRQSFEVALKSGADGLTEEARFRLLGFVLREDIVVPQTEETVLEFRSSLARFFSTS